MIYLYIAINIICISFLCYFGYSLFCLKIKNKLKNAILNKNHELITQIVKTEGKVDRLDHDNKTALMIAAQTGYIEGIELLLSLKADVNLSVAENTAIKHSIENEQIEAVKTLINSGANISSNSDTIKLILNYGIGTSSKFKILFLKELIDKTEGLYRFIPRKYGFALVDYIENRVKNYNNPLIEEISKENSEFTLHNLLIIASAGGYLELVCILIGLGIDVNKRGYLGATALWEAYMSRQTKVAELLKLNGAVYQEVFENYQVMLPYRDHHGNIQYETRERPRTESVYWNEFD